MYNVDFNVAAYEEIMLEAGLNRFIPAKQRAKRELARIWRLPRGSNTPPLWGELAKKKLSHAPLLAAGYLTMSVKQWVTRTNSKGIVEKGRTVWRDIRI
jgi:hypothetical protein